MISKAFVKVQAPMPSFIVQLVQPIPQSQLWYHPSKFPKEEIQKVHFFS